MTDSDIPARRSAGRPRKHAGESRTSHTFRLRDTVRERIQKAAERHQRSISEEIEFRVEQTLEDERLLEVVLGAGPMAPMFRAFKDVVDRTVRKAAEQSPPLLPQEVSAEIQTALSVVAQNYFPNGLPRPQHPGEPIRNRKPGDVGICAAWDVLTFLDHEWLDERRPAKRPSRTLANIMARDARGDFKNKGEPAD